MRIKKGLALLLAAVMMLGTAACGGSESGTVIARVTDADSGDSLSEITEGELDGIIQLSAHLVGQDMEALKSQEELYAALKQDMLRSMMSFELMRLELENRGAEVFPEDYEDQLDEFVKSDQVKGAGVGKGIVTKYFEMAYYSQAFSSEAGKEITDEEVRKYYEDNRATAYTATAATGKVSHILVDSEELANEIYDKIMGGADFAEMAKQYGTDGTKDQGGSLGVLAEDEAGYDTDFMKGAFALKSDEVSKPVKTQFGYHIIKMEDRTEAGGVTPFEDAEEEIRSQLANNKASELLTELTKKYKVEYLGEYESMNESAGDNADGAAGDDADGGEGDDADGGDPADDAAGAGEGDDGSNE